MQTTTAGSIAALERGDHFCGIYTTEAEHAEFMSEFVRQGLQRGEKVLYLYDLHPVAELRAMFDAAGIDVDAMLASGQLVLMSARETYVRGGAFDPDRIIDEVWTPVLSAAQAEGYPAVRVTGETGWVLSGASGTERTIEYESKVNAFIADHGLIAACQYCRGRFDSEFLMDVLRVHPKVFVGSTVCENRGHYYVPSEDLLGADPQRAILDRCLDNLTTSVRRPDRDH